MRRLTKIDGTGRNVIEVKKNCKDDYWYISKMSDGVTTRFHSKAIDKLAAFEDFMEERGFEDLEHLKIRLENLSYGAKYYVRWEKLKEWVGEFHRDVVAVYPKTLLTKIQKLELAD